ncbi:MAG: AbrB/MazE/SpoVT family DNA-binding domain-containing protein [Candidatus Cloacimonetes bacterium]|nr:AbrB/MazE/SpoVT family DNA-binding domain-containing protein [Candidatus Cloacimonadota bacterium]
MKTTIIPIGNSKGIRIPKAIIEQCHIEKDVDLEIKDGKIIIMPIKYKPREDWEKAFKMMHDSHDDQLIVDDNIDLEIGEWEW